MIKKILFVCLGNICRSPAAEAVFLHAINSLDIKDQYQVDSAGTGGWHVGRKPDIRMQEAARKRGIILQSRARQITIDDFDKFDLILTMDNANLAEVNALSKEFKSPLITKIRPILSFARQTDLTEVPDPYYGGQNGFGNHLASTNQLPNQ